MKKVGLEKYKGLLITLMFFLVFFLVISLLNLYMGKSVNSENSRLLLIKSLQEDVTEYKYNINQLATDNQASNLITRLSNKLNVLLNGGRFEKYEFNKLNTTSDKSLIEKLVVQINNLNTTDADNTELIGLLEQNISQLNQQWTAVINQKTKRFNVLQYLAMVLAVLYFLGIIIQMVKNFENIDSEIESVKGETDNILATVNEGLFLLTPDLEIGSQQSGALKNIFGLKEDIEGNFIQFLEKYVPKNSLDIAIDFLSLLFGKRVKEKLIDDLNPLKKVQINIERRDGSFEIHYIDFNFKRVIENKEIKNVLGSVTDVTQEVLLQQELEETKEQSEAQIDLFMSVLHVPPAQLKLFMLGVERSITQINTILKNTTDKDYKEKVYCIDRIVHKVKGDAAILNLHSFEIKAHEFEQVLSTLKSKAKLKGENLLPLAIQLKSMISHKETFQGIFNRFDENKAAINTVNHGSHEATQNLMGEESISDLMLLSKRIAKETDKHVALTEYCGLEGIANEELKSKIRDCTIQLVRNAIVHGIESPHSRMLKGKTALGNIFVSCAQTDNSIELVVKDDGAGLDINSIKKTAINKGIFDAETLATLTEKQIAMLIFRPDFSTRSEADLNAGRGVGLNLVKTISVELNAKLMMNWKEDKFTIFKLVFPMTNTQAPV